MRQVLLLDAMLRMTAFDCASRAGTCEVMERSPWHASFHVFRLVMADLFDRDLIQDLNEPYGGVWLSPKGKLLALTDDMRLEFRD